MKLEVLSLVLRLDCLSCVLTVLSTILVGRRCWEGWVLAAATNRRFAHPAADSARDFRSLPRRFDLARCLGLHYQRVVAADHVITLGAHSIPLPPLPGHRGYAGETVELSHQLDGTLRVYRGNHLLLALPLPMEEDAGRRPAPITSAKKRKTPIPRIYNLSGRPALAAVT